jgi:hypothetical protein
MSQRGDLTRPKVRRPACLHPDQTGRKSSKEGNDLAAAHTTAQNDLPGFIDAVELENMLREINADGANLAHGWLPLLVIFDDHQLGTQMPSGGHPPHQFEISGDM